MKMVSGEITFMQEDDSCHKSEEEYQSLKIKIEDAGGGPFLVLDTKRWAINNKEELRLLLSRLDSILEYHDLS